MIKIAQNSVVFEIAWGDLSVIEYRWDIFAKMSFNNSDKQYTTTLYFLTHLKSSGIALIFLKESEYF